MHKFLTKIHFLAILALELEWTNENIDSINLEKLMKLGQNQFVWW